MSFFEEEPPTRRTATPPRRRAAASTAPPRRTGGGGAGGSGGPGSDQQTLLVRRGVAIAGAVVLFLLLAVVINSCRGSARENALKDYNRQASSIARESETQVGEQFFGLFGAKAAEASPTDLQTQVASLRQEADQQFRRAKRLDVPDAMVPAQRSLLIALELRRDGLDVVGLRIRAALGDDGDAADEATQSIAGQMQSFLASDVVHRARVVPLIKEALDDAEVGGQEIDGSKFVPGVQWLSPTFVGERLGSGGGGGDSGSSTPNDDEPEPGTHGTGLTSVSVGETALTPDGSNRIAAAGAPTFDVEFANQGENDEQDVRVDVSVQGESGAAIRGSDTVDTIARGATATASVRLPRTPPTGQALTITVRVRAVPGEEMEENNTQEFQALFEG